MLQGLKRRLLLRAVREELVIVKRNRQPHSFESARSIGVLFVAAQGKMPKELEAILDDLKKKGKILELLAFIPVKKIEKPPSFPHFTLKETNWSGNPAEAASVQAFCTHKFDLLWVVNPEDSLTLDWVAVHSQAAMKIGSATQHPNDYDFQIDTPAGKNLQFFFQQLEHYLDKIVLTKHESSKAT